MKKYFFVLFCICFSFVFSNISQAKPYPKKQYTQNDNLIIVDNDGVGGLLGIMSGTLVSLSTLDSATRNHEIAIIQHAELDALKYEEGTQPTITFLNAKLTVEKLNNTALTNEQAALVIAELNQKFREE